MYFKADFEVDVNGEYVGKKVEFTSTSQVGFVVDSDNLGIEGNVSKDEIGVLNDTTGLYDFNTAYSEVTQIQKVLWETDDGMKYSDEKPQHSYRIPKVYNAVLTVYSEMFEVNGKKFRFKHTIIKEIEVKSRFYKFMVDNYPLWEFLGTPEALSDIFKAAAKFYDRLYSDITEVFNLVDVEMVNPIYFEYLASTLGHDSFYAKKVGYNREISKFNEYDIYERVKLGIATKAEILQFREFLKLSSEIFKKKGTPSDITRFFSFFSINAKAIELWTEHWGTKPIGLQKAWFSGIDRFVDNKLDLKWSNLRVIGNDNDRGHLSKEFSNIKLDNFHKIQKIDYDEDVVGTVGGSGENSDWVEFELQFDIPRIKDIRKENGEELANWDEVNAEDVYEIVKNEPQRYRSNEEYPYILRVNPNYLTIGDRISVLSHKIESEIIDSLVSTTDKNIKNFDAILEFTQPDPKNNLDFDFLKSPENEIFIIFRGVTKNDDPYANFNEYYKVSLNPLRATLSVSKVVQQGIGDNAKLVTQKLNLTQDKENLVYDMLVLDEKSDPIVVETLRFNKIYEIRVSVVEEILNVWLREKTNEDSIQKNIEADIGGNEWSKEEPEWFNIVQNLSLDASPDTVLSFDSNEEELTAENYEYIDIGGNIGFGIRNSVTVIREFNVNVIDFDTTLYNDDEKMINIKPKYLDWLKDQELLANNYDKSKDLFVRDITKNFDFQEKSIFNINENQSDSLQFLYFDDLEINEDLATRYTVTFDENWLRDTFTTKSEIEDKIIIPIGQQKGWFMPENRIYDLSTYKNFFGDSETYKEVVDDSTGIEVTRKITNIPGLFSYEKNTILDTYYTEPFDSFSDLTKINDQTFSINEKCKQIKSSGKLFGTIGIFEEVYPNSNKFDSIGDIIENDDGSSFINKLFLPIVFEAGEARRVVGVRFKNCNEITKIINKLSNEIHSDVQLWGSFTFTIHNSAVKFRPSSKVALETDPENPNHYLCTIFVPLGVLDDTRKNYSLSTEFLHNIENSGVTQIKLNGVFVRLFNEHLSYDGDNIKLLFSNEFESKEKGLYVRRYLSAKIDLKAKIERIQTLNSEDLPTTYAVDSVSRKFFKELEKDITSFNWWKPTEIWRKRNFSIESVSLDGDVLSGLTFGDTTINKIFYGNEFSEKPKGLRLRFNDGQITPNAVYYAKVKFKIDYSGFSANQVAADSQSSYKALSEDDARRLKVPGGAKEKYFDWKTAPAGSCYELYIPISWYDKNTTGDNNIIEWANYISNSSDGSLTFTPIGMMSWFINNSADAGRQIPDELKDLISTTKDWDLTDWNDYFLNNMYIEFIAEKVPESVYKIFDKLAFLNIYSINVGSYLNIKYDQASLPWKVFNNTRLYSRSINKFIYDIPKEVKPLEKWIGNVDKITFNNLVVPLNYYDVNKTAIVMKDSDFLRSATGANLKAVYISDLFFDSNTTEVVKDDFNITRQITWIPYEADDSEKYVIVTPQASESMVFSSNDSLYEIVEVNKEKAFKPIMTKTGIELSYGKNKAGVVKDNLVKFDKDSQLNISKVFLLNEKNIVFDISADVYFDPEMDNLKSYKGKKFEFILNSDILNDPNTKNNILDNYYFVGIGTYDFDISLGQAKFDPTNDIINKSFLAGFGEYKTQGIKTGVWYTLRCVVTKTTVKVFFNVRDDNEKLVISYDIDNLNEQSDKKITGKFEEAVYLAAGLTNMGITYPQNLESKTTKGFLAENFNEEMINAFKPNGILTGIRVFNEFTFITNIQYKYQVQGKRRFGNPSDTLDLSSILFQIEKLGGDSNNISFIGKTLSGTIVIQSGDKLFYKLNNQNVNFYDDGIRKVYINKDKVVILYTPSKNNYVIVMDGKFQTTRNLFIEDQAFNKDQLYRYLEATNRGIEDIFINNDKINIVFGDVQ